MSKNYSAIGSLFNSTADAVVGISEGTVVFMNPRARQLLGPEDGAECAALCAMIAEDEVENLRFTYDIDGESFSVCAACCDGLWLVCLSSARENAGDVALAFGVSGQMSQSIMTLRAAAEGMMEKARFKGLEIGEYGSILYRSIFQLQRLSGNLSSLAAIGSGTLPLRRKTTDMCSFLSQLADTVDVFFPGRVELEIKSGGIFAEIDEELVSRMVLNVLQNSLQRLEEGSKIRLCLKSAGRYAVITVSDNCGGIPAEMLGRVFAKYTNPSALSDGADGIGLGLGVSQGIAKAHGGSMLVESHEGEGTQVHMMLPLSDGTAALSGGVAPGVGMELFLRELSGVLGREFYCEKYMD